MIRSRIPLPSPQGRQLFPGAMNWGAGRSDGGAEQCPGQTDHLPAHRKNTTAAERDTHRKATEEAKHRKSHEFSSKTFTFPLGELEDAMVGLGVVPICRRLPFVTNDRSILMAASKTWEVSRDAVSAGTRQGSSIR
jgi:hypothetical protein